MAAAASQWKSRWRHVVTGAGGNYERLRDNRNFLPATILQHLTDSKLISTEVHKNLTSWSSYEKKNTAFLDFLANQSREQTVKLIDAYKQHNDADEEAANILEEMLETADYD